MLKKDFIKSTNADIITEEWEQLWTIKILYSYLWLAQIPDASSLILSGMLGIGPFTLTHEDEEEAAAAAGDSWAFT